MVGAPIIGRDQSYPRESEGLLSTFRNVKTHGRADLRDLGIPGTSSQHFGRNNPKFREFKFPNCSARRADFPSCEARLVVEH